MGGKKFKLLSDHITWDVATDRYNALRTEYYEMSKVAIAEAKIAFDEKITSLDLLCSLTSSLYEDLFKKYLKTSVRKLVEFGIYNIDEVVLLEIVESRYDLRYKCVLANIKNQVYGIDAEVREKEAAGKETVNSLLKTSGELAGSGASDMAIGATYESSGDFASGMLGAAAGAAGLLVAGGAALYNNHQNKIAQEEAEKKKASLFEDESNRNELCEAFAYDVFVLYETVGAIVNERLEDSGYYYYPTEEQLCALEPICRNLFEGNFNNVSDKPNLERDMIYHIMQVNPYDDRVYSYILMKEDTLTDELKEIINYLNIDMPKLADAYLYLRYRLDEFDTYEAICDFEPVVEKEMNMFGINEGAFYNEFIDIKQQLFEKRRTFNGFVYETIEDRDNAEVQYNKFFEDGKEIEELSLDEAIQKYYATLPDNIYPKNREDLQAIFMHQITNSFDTLTTSVMVEPYIVDAEQKRIVFQYAELALITELSKYKKKLETKEKMEETVAAAKEKAAEVAGAAKEKAGAMAGLAKNKSKEFMSKLPFDKKKKAEAEASQPQIEAAVTQETVVDTKFCPQCGNSLKATAKFCGKCGNRF